ncbi:hypothetical protein VTK26DRAFT_390 [Humicola hyalothermophila]
MASLLALPPLPQLIYCVGRWEKRDGGFDQDWKRRPVSEVPIGAAITPTFSFCLLHHSPSGGGVTNLHPPSTLVPRDEGLLASGWTGQPGRVLEGAEALEPPRCPAAQARFRRRHRIIKLFLCPMLVPQSWTRACEKRANLDHRWGSPHLGSDKRCQGIPH